MIFSILPHLPADPLLLLGGAASPQARSVVTVPVSRAPHGVAHALYTLDSPLLRAQHLHEAGYTAKRGRLRRSSPHN